MVDICCICSSCFQVGLNIFHLSATICLFVFMFDVGRWGKASGLHLHINNNHRSTFWWRIQVTMSFELEDNLFDNWNEIVKLYWFHSLQNVGLAFVHLRESNSVLSHLIRLSPNKTCTFQILLLVGVLVIQIEFQCKVSALHNFFRATHMWRNQVCFKNNAPVLSMWPCKRKLDEEKSKHAWFGLAIWFWPNIFAQDAKTSHNKA